MSNPCSRTSLLRTFLWFVVACRKIRVSFIVYKTVARIARTICTTVYGAAQRPTKLHYITTMAASKRLLLLYSSN